ncbi:hypothetical protein [Desulfolutivibrio sp.]|uniref:hypothetical protein n=1 Tax=Desulfolutivibrio sp. TaxID=2773296 RepID=UPI002F96D9B2
MADPLEKWQGRLERHFESLARMRGDTDFPIFALEHGLSEAELEQLSRILRSCLTVRQLLFPHWLLWVIYATERGYSYTGDEYWPSFEEQTPGWEFYDRNRIKPWFRKFQTAYHGVIPSGPWAERFSIIAWPITHAILPRYLQHQFARALYDLRFSLASLVNLDPRAIGRHLAINAQYASTRFQEFLQQEELTGRIVLAIFGAKPPQGKEPIYPPTLRRIVTDLEEVRNAREWLKEAKRVVSDRFKGIGRGTEPIVCRPFICPLSRTAADSVNLSIRPNLLLRHAGGGTWSVLLEVPSFRSIAVLSADFQSFLQRTRCRLNGGGGMKPTGWLLSGNRKGVLRRWPDPAEPLIQFEHTLPALDHFLETECRLSRGPIWLFKIGSDGMAREITGRVVRPGQSYIVVTTEELPQAHAGVTPCNFDCEGARAVRLAVPSDVSVETTEWLHGLDLQVARTIRIWPAGLPGRGWDGEGKSEWLTTEAPCFGIEHDHPVDGYTLCLDNGRETLIETDGAKPIFVRISPLPVGAHSLTVKALRSPSLDAIASSPSAEGHAQLSVREPEPWTHGVAAHPGLIVTVDPHDPDLDTLWRNEVRLSIFGPEGYTVTFTLRLLAADGREILAERIGTPMNLPVKPEVWQQHLKQFLKQDEHNWSYLEASSGELTIEGETLGRCSLRFEHDALPLRWVLRHDRSNIILRLVNDSGQNETKPEVRFHSMEHPLKAAPLAAETVLSGYKILPPGGLFLATHGDYSDAIAVSAGLMGEGLQGLCITPRFDELSSSSSSLARALRLLAFWCTTRLSGFVANARRQMVINGFLQALFGKLCGPTWAQGETQFRNNPNSPHSIEFLKKNVAKRASFAVALVNHHSKMDGDAAEGARWFADRAASYGVCEDHTLSEFALRVASQPHRLPAAYGENLDQLLRQLADTPAILRGARLLALLTARQNRDTPLSLLPRWKW